jgi:hypothetical protein
MDSGNHIRPRSGEGCAARLPPACALGAALACLGCAHPLPPGDAVAAWRVGPLLEEARTAEGDRLFAARPLFSSERAAGTPPRGVTDILWPVGTVQQGGDRLRWRFFPFYGMTDEDDPEGAYRFRLFPLYFEGRTREGEDYRALFPLGGSIHDLPLLDNFRFVLFPLYGESEIAGTRMRTVLWPFHLTRHGDNIDQLRLFPFWGEKHVTGPRATTSRFILWPFWSEVRFEGERLQGDSFILFPLYGRTRLDREQGWMVLPPLFSRTTGTNGLRKLNAPWPFVRLLDDGARRQRHCWPLHGTETAPGRASWYALWPIVRSSRDERRDLTVERFHVVPFYFQENRLAAPAATNEAPRRVAAFRRFWPLFSWQRNEEGSRFRTLELNPFRGSVAVERNWAPLWSLFTRRARADGSRASDLLWGLAAWGRDAEQRPFLQLLWAFRFGDGWAQAREGGEEREPQP